MLYCYLLDIVSHLQPLSHRCQLSFNESLILKKINYYKKLVILPVLVINNKYV